MAPPEYLLASYGAALRQTYNLTARHLLNIIIETDRCQLAFEIIFQESGSTNQFVFPGKFLIQYCYLYIPNLPKRKQPSFQLRQRTCQPCYLCIFSQPIQISVESLSYHLPSVKLHPLQMYSDIYVKQRPDKSAKMQQIFQVTEE